MDDNTPKQILIGVLIFAGLLIVATFIIIAYTQVRELNLEDAKLKAIEVIAEKYDGKSTLQINIETRK